MSPKNKKDLQESKPNAQIKSSIVHKPFATGTINIFNPHRAKSKGDNQAKSQLTAPKLYLNAQLEKSEQLPTLAVRDAEPEEVEYHDAHWFDRLLNPWSISAIAIIFLANLISGAVIWRNYRLAANSQPVKNSPTLGSANLATEEFMPLNLSTLSRLQTAKDESELTLTEPISPALAPISLARSTFEPEHYYLLSEYQGDASLALARQQVKQVSLVNLPQGVFIYLGAYKDLEQAEQFLEHLKQQNFAAQIYPFD
ncbi:MAG: hypothetical protein AAFO95_12895 [Cyanobacteria bacterium J06600_6]